MSRKTYSKPKKNALILHTRALLAAGKSLYAACAEVKVAQSCMTKWLNPPPAKPRKKIGRPRKLNLTAEEAQHFQRLHLDHESIPLAALRVLQAETTTDETKFALARIFSRAADEGKTPTWPVSLIELARIPEALRAMHRGPKHAREFEPKVRRNGEFEMEDGTVIKWAPGWIYESDDMSLNEPFRFHDPGLGRETAGRQGLFTIDAASVANLQSDLCGRPHDAYRVEDIADHFLNVVDAYGLPVFWRLERGSWESNFVQGIPLKGREGRWGSLSDLFYVRHKFQSTGKANVERSFHESQKLSAHQSTHIGRSRGEFETATKLYRKAQEGNAQALEYFWNILVAADCVKEILSEENRRMRDYPKLDGIRSSPENLMKGHVPTRLKDEDRWYFMPVKREAFIRKGVIQVKVDHYARPFRFLAGEERIFLKFQEKHPVLIAFHPGKADELGCYVFNAATGPAAKGHAWGELLGIVPLFRDTPEECLHGEGDFSQASKARAHIRAEYRSIIPVGTGPGTKKSIARDGLGNALAIQTGGSQADEVIQPPKPKRQVPLPSVSSRHSPVDKVAEIARLHAALYED